MCSSGDCYIVLPPHSETLIFGRNSVEAAEGVAQEIVFYEAGAAAAEGNSDGGAAPEVEGDTFRLILQKPAAGVWGGDCGANERNVCVGLTWVSDEAESGSGNLKATDIVRFALATSECAASAVERIGALIAAHGADGAKSNFVVCDAAEAWSISCGGQLWAAQRFTTGFRRFVGNGLMVTSTFTKSSVGLGDALKSLGLWDGEGDLNFAACFGAAVADVDSAAAWSGVEPAVDGAYTLTSMFETLRSAEQAASARSATVAVLTQSGGISCHWFTATPNVIESVFKPFVFAPNPKISPLTQVPAADGLTLLHKLHAQRKPNAVEDLKALESSCVDEMNRYLAEHPAADEELDELMKDCVEAEVKFYR